VKLIDDYRILHAANAFTGMTIAVFAEPVLKLIAYHGAHSILDYGSGKGLAWQEVERLKKYKEKLEVKLYDPGIEELAEKPKGTFDAVVCMDVVEHIPEDELEMTLAEIFNYADRLVIATFCARGSRKKLPSTGQDVHITQKPRLWWEERFHMANVTKSKPVPWYLFENV